MASPFAGAKLIKKDGSSVSASALDGKVVVLYFSAAWCPPCHRFTPVLADFYDDVKQMGGNIEIIYIPGDNSEAEMMEYFRNEHADYLALSMNEQSLIKSLNTRYSVRGIPCVVVIQPDGTPIDTAARGAVQGKGPAAFEEWKAQWQGSTFAGVGHTLGGNGGGGTGVSRLLAGSGGGAAATSTATERSTDGYDEQAALAAAIAASLHNTPAAADVGAGSSGAALTRTRSDEERTRRAAAENDAMLSRADSDVLDAELAVAAMEIQYTKVDTAVAALQEKNTTAIVRTAVELLVKILSNLQRDPNNPKFRRIRKDNKQVAGKVLVARGALSLLLAVGFESVDNFLVMGDGACDAAKIGHSVAALQGVLAGQAEAQQAARVAQMEALRQDAAAKKEQRDRLKAAAAEDKQARRDPKWKAKSFEKSGKDIARFSDIGVDLNAGGG